MFPEVIFIDTAGGEVWASACGVSMLIEEVKSAATKTKTEIICLDLVENNEFRSIFLI